MLFLIKTSPYKINNFSTWNVLKLTAGFQRGTGDSVSERILASVFHMGPGQATRGQCAGAQYWLLKHSPNRFRLLCLLFASFLRLR